MSAEARALAVRGPFLGPLPKSAGASPPAADRPRQLSAIVPVVICATVILGFSNRETLQASLRELWQILEPRLPDVLDALEVPRRAKLRKNLLAAGTERPGLAVAVLLALLARANPSHSAPMMMQAATPYLLDALRQLRPPRSGQLREAFLERLKTAVVLARCDPAVWLDGCADGDFIRAFRLALRRGAEADDSRRSADLELSEETLAYGAYRSDVEVQVEARLELEEVWAGLSDGERYVVSLSFSGYSGAEIAQRVDAKPGAVRQRVSWMRKRLGARAPAR